MRKSMLPTLVLLSTAGLFALTGCSGAAQSNDAAEESSSAPSASASASESEASSSEQTIAEACDVAQTTLSSVQTQMTDAMSGIGAGDLTAAVDAMTTFETTLGSAIDEISNADVEAALTDFQVNVSSFNDILVNAQTGGTEALAANAEALQTAATDLQTSATEIGELCS